MSPDSADPFRWFRSSLTVLLAFLRALCCSEAAGTDHEASSTCHLSTAAPRSLRALQGPSLQGPASAAAPNATSSHSTEIEATASAALDACTYLVQGVQPWPVGAHRGLASIVLMTIATTDGESNRRRLSTG